MQRAAGKLRGGGVGLLMYCGTYVPCCIRLVFHSIPCLLFLPLTLSMQHGPSPCCRTRKQFVSDMCVHASLAQIPCIHHDSPCLIAGSHVTSLVVECETHKLLCLTHGHAHTRRACS